jgi:hypothetical protein
MRLLPRRTGLETLPPEQVHSIADFHVVPVVESSEPTGRPRAEVAPPFGVPNTGRKRPMGRDFGQPPGKSLARGESRKSFSHKHFAKILGAVSPSNKAVLS